MTRHLLDTDAVIDYFNGFPPTVELIRRLHRQGDDLCTCDVVVAEVVSGLSASERASGRELLTSLRFLPTSPAAADQAGVWRHDFARRGSRLATTDRLVAAIAREHEAILVTGNLADYPMPEVSVLPLQRRGGKPQR